MTIRALVERERRHLRRAEIAAAVLLAAALTALLVAGGAALLGRARWLSLPRGLPLTIWILVGVVIAALAYRTRQRLDRRSSRRDVALAIEREQGMRRGALVGVLELEGQGALAERADAAFVARCPPMRRSHRRCAARVHSGRWLDWVRRRRAYSCC